ncbi:N,N'-diacetylbacillosaminyl-diphospho-undecaprenol alpha-1,3-N-acetylgalactosaminyltransferase [Rosistilla carotiformis]|uniref:N, N'-diacetylbacillosaminyl-diphospho-undecaprenol alpha-1,3-N-acetylgalactosaminyltransferase n=2 Tax=Rosistilla carotiformis TaxID=2528017 RepID=A0A518JVF7_9BACT|nr:N,N'-diacetylbacillosaminyl-diphospho-undecaprenol alpha-1,3-N-acetylgalactosaminyltransferase [Rosistilla carotiformis]
MGDPKIVQVSTNQSGGAGIAALRLHRGLRMEGVHSRFLSGLGQPDSRWEVDVLSKRYPRFWERALGKVGVHRSQQILWEKETCRLGCQDIFTTSIESDAKLIDHAWMQDADIINLHWVSGILSWKELFKRCRVPIVWTLHDMNAFMGIFHYEFDRQRGSHASQVKDADVIREKIQLMQSDIKPVIVTPSRWLKDQSVASELFWGLRHEVIANGLDTAIFKPYPQRFARTVFGLNPDKKLLLVVAERLADQRKGFGLLLQALRLPELQRNWEIVAVGDGELPLENLQYHRVGAINDERLMGLLYSAVDLVVIASREDNLPNVILESLCCGTPVVGTPAGGIPEPIVPARDGLVAKAVTGEALSAAIRQAIEMPFVREKIAAEAAARYDLSVVSRRYRQLYEELLKVTL